MKEKRLLILVLKVDFSQDDLFSSCDFVWRKKKSKNDFFKKEKYEVKQFRVRMGTLMVTRNLISIYLDSPPIYSFTS